MRCPAVWLVTSFFVFFDAEDRRTVSKSMPFTSLSCRCTFDRLCPSKHKLQLARRGIPPRTVPSDDLVGGDPYECDVGDSIVDGRTTPTRGCDDVTERDRYALLSVEM